MPEAFLFEHIERQGIAPRMPVPELSVIERFLIRFIPYLLLMPQRISEGGYSVELNIDGMKNLLGYLEKKHQMESTQRSATVRDVSKQW